MARIIIALTLILLINSCVKEEHPRFKSLGESKISPPTQKDNTNTIIFNKPTSSVLLEGNCDARIKKLEISLGDTNSWKPVSEVASSYNNNCGTNKSYSITLSPIGAMFPFLNNVASQQYAIYIRGDLGTIKSGTTKFIVDSGYAYLIDAPKMTSSNPVTVTSSNDVITITGTCSTRLSTLQYKINSGPFTNFSNASTGTLNNCTSDGTFTLVFDTATNFIAFDRNSNSQSYTVTIQGLDGDLLSAPLLITVNSGDILGPLPPKLTTFSHPNDAKMYITEKSANTDVAIYKCSLNQSTWFTCSDGDTITDNGTSLPYFYSGTLYLKSIDDVGNESTIASAPFQKDYIERGSDVGYGTYLQFINDTQIIFSNEYSRIFTKRFPSLLKINSDGSLNTDFKPFYTQSTIYSIFNDPDSANTLISLQGTSELIGVDDSGNLSYGESESLDSYIYYKGHDNDYIYFKRSLNPYDLKRISRSNGTFDGTFNIDFGSNVNQWDIGTTGIFASNSTDIKKYDFNGNEIPSYASNLGTKNDSGGLTYRYLTSSDQMIILGDFTSFNGHLSNHFITLASDGNILPNFNSGTGFNFWSSNYLPAFNKLNDELFWNYTTSLYNYNGNNINAGSDGLNIISPDRSINQLINLPSTVLTYIGTSKFKTDVEKTSLFYSYANELKKYDSNYIEDITFTTNSGQVPKYNPTHISSTDDGGFVLAQNIEIYSTSNSVTDSVLATIAAGSSTLTASSLPKSSRLEALPDGKFLLWGNFSIVSGYSHRYIARLNSDLSRDGTINYPAPPTYPNDVTVDNNGYIYYCKENMKSFSGVNTGAIAKLDSNGIVITDAGGFNDHGNYSGLDDLNYFSTLPSGKKTYCHISADGEHLYFKTASASNYRGTALASSKIYRLKTSDGSLDQTFDLSGINFTFSNYDSVTYASVNGKLYIIHNDGTKEQISSQQTSYTSYLIAKNGNKLYLAYSPSIYEIDIEKNTTRTISLGSDCQFSDVILDKINNIFYATIQATAEFCQGYMVNGIARFDLNGSILRDEFTGYRSSE